MDFKLNKTYYLPTDGYTIKYRQDNCNPLIIHVELFYEQKVHKEMVKCVDYNIDKNHFQVINELESKILLNKLDPTGLNQIL